MTDRRPDVSVVVPFFNSGQTLRACIDSLLAVDAAPGSVEVIVVDNGSSDDSAAIADSFDGITVLREEKRGAYAARNTGIRTASAPIIAFTDADCTVAPDWVQALRSALEDPGVGIVIGHCDYPGRASAVLRLIGTWENAKSAYIAEACSPDQRVAYCNNMAVRASLFEDIGLYREWLRAGDSEFAHRLAEVRPGLSLRFEPTMRIVHHEFTRARDRARRLRVYTGTNTQIEGFRELDVGQRMAVLWNMIAKGGGRAG